MKQYKISTWLKGITIAIGIMGIFFFGGVTFFALLLKEDAANGLLWSFVFFSWFTAALCYAILFQFWKVCTEIGRDNSFSLENARSFHCMSCLGGGIGFGYVLRFLWLLFIGEFGIITIIMFIFQVFLSLILVVLCEALSRLIRNAYEVKLENELTI